MKAVWEAKETEQEATRDAQLKIARLEETRREERAKAQATRARTLLLPVPEPAAAASKPGTGKSSITHSKPGTGTSSITCEIVSSSDEDVMDYTH